MTDTPAVTAVMAVLAAHRWKSMGVASVECECGAILCGDENLTQFPADEAFRRHLAEAAVEAAREPAAGAPDLTVLVADVLDDLSADLYDAARAEEREACARWLETRAKSGMATPAAAYELEKCARLLREETQ